MTQPKKRVFIGRERELAILKDLSLSRSASFAVIKGRRRIGKSRLIQEFGKSLRTLYFLGLAPEEKISPYDQRRHFANQLEKQIGVGGIQAHDWDHLFGHLAKQASSGQILIVLDEINWMGSKDPTFLPKLKTAWDTEFSKNPQLILILSGSMSGWIEDHILKSTGFLGRITQDITLEELPLNKCSQFWGSHAKRVSAYEKFKILSVTGGVPLYLELIRPDLTAEENIQRLCFSREGLLFNEFDRIFSDLFSRRTKTYRKIIEQLTYTAAPMDRILSQLGTKASGVFSDYLDDLVKTGYLTRDHTWSIKTLRESKTSQYRLKDNYLRFYLRYIEPKRNLINRVGTITPPQWHTIMGFQFENLVLNNRPALYQILGLNSNEIEFDNPFIQTKTKAREGCQIDLLIQTHYHTLYLCEIKFSKKEIGVSIIQEVQEKIKRLVLPRGFSIRPVLIHVNGVSESVEDSDFFSHIVDFSRLFEGG
ncbi:MAG: hypothetical protein K940chlam9_00805 [Chlamydiae bacterium]|nr:hypothetical protein [Chlamydiota bacterium]